jgi:Ca2+-transporting ATPase
LLRPDQLFENRTLDAALVASSAIGALPFFVPGLRRLLGIAPLGAADAAVALGAALVPFSSVLARRGIRTALAEIEPDIERLAAAREAEARGDDAGEEAQTGERAA